MAWRIPPSQTTQITLTDDQDVLIGHLVAITVESGYGILGEFSNHHARIYGLVASSADTAIRLGTDISVGEVLEIYDDAQVHGAGTTFAVTVSGIGSQVTNSGLITATGIGVGLGGGDATATSTLTNIGTIDAGEGAIQCIGPQMIDVVNSGTLKGVLYSFRGEGASHITNRGTMIGDITFGIYGDFYDGRLGTTKGDVFGGFGTDRLYSGAGNDRLFGEYDNDTLMGGAGADYLSGGSGTDRASYASATPAVTVSLANPSINTGDAKGDTYNSIENLSGSNYNDNVFGNGANNGINGGAGNDVIKGYAGNDALTGYTGQDVYVFNTALNASTNVDTITDFNAAADTIHIDDAFFPGLPAGALAASAFKDVAVAAKDSSDRILYNSDTGSLFYDRDGSGGAYAAIKFASLAGSPTLTAADFVLI